jgi:leader peptidase (prepilin peptidase)/N-methyltransferase
MIRTLGTIFAALVGLAFGSFLNVCLSRWPKGESIIRPPSHCPACSHTLAWWENIPIFSWIFLRGRCRACRKRIAVRYLFIEAATGLLFAIEAWQALSALDLSNPGFSTLDFAAIEPLEINLTLANALSRMALYWLLLALAMLDLEHLWLPDLLTYPGILCGVAVNMALVGYESLPGFVFSNLTLAAEKEVVAVVAGAGVIILIRWLYWLVRRREGIGMGDAKLMALLGAWLGLPGMFLAFGLGVVLGATVGILLLALPSSRRREQGWAHTQLPLGTFLCLGGLLSGLWGETILAAYFRWSGL